MTQTVKTGPAAAAAIHKKARRKVLLKRALIYAGLSLVAVYLVFPYVFMLSRSFMSERYISNLPIKFFPNAEGFSLEGYRVLFVENNYFQYLFNTVKIMAINIVAVPIAASLCAYGFAKVRFSGNKIIFAMMMSTLMIPGTVTQVPLYVLFSDLGWTQDIRPLVIPALFGGGAINIFLLVQFMRNVPNELENAARIDGANMFQRYLFITIPLCGPILLYVAVNVFSGTWSDFYGPLIYLKSEDAYTLAVAIYYDCVGPRADLNAINTQRAAGVFMSFLPAVVFLVYQRKLVDGIMIGAIKG